MTNRGNGGEIDPPVAKNNDTAQKSTVQSPANNNQVAIKENEQPNNAVKKEKSAVAVDQKNLAVTDKQKKPGVKSNIERNNIVTHKSKIEKNDVAVKEPIVKVQPDPGHEEEDKVKAKPMYAGVEKSSEVIKTGLAALTKQPGSALTKEEKPVYYYIDEEEDIKLANASINKKPVRGLIRKVKGLFEGSNDDNEQPQQENKKGIRIAAFSIALK